MKYRFFRLFNSRAIMVRTKVQFKQRIQMVLPRLTDIWEFPKSQTQNGLCKDVSSKFCTIPVTVKFKYKFTKIDYFQNKFDFK